MKQNRHEAILQIIEEKEVETQEELAALLTQKGYNVTQATVSRDIKALRLLKTIGSKGSYKYTRSDEKKDVTDNSSFLAKSVTHVDFAQNIVVIKTRSGMAQGAAAVIDSMKLTELIGTIAGDDTIMCVVRTMDDALKLTVKIKAMA